jgi:transposase InsO family protein
MVTWAETFTGHSLTSVRSDQGGEFMAGELQSFFKSRGITHQISVPHTPQQNGRAERFNRTLLEKAEAICQHACLPQSFWKDAVDTALHIYNQQPMRRHEWKTPIEQFNGDQPDVSYFRVFGTRAYV